MVLIFCIPTFWHLHLNSLLHNYLKSSFPVYTEENQIIGDDIRNLKSPIPHKIAGFLRSIQILRPYNKYTKCVSISTKMNCFSKHSKKHAACFSYQITMIQFSRNILQFLLLSGSISYWRAILFFWILVLHL